jgi:hypothetical protein
MSYASLRSIRAILKSKALLLVGLLALLPISANAADVLFVVGTIPLVQGDTAAQNAMTALGHNVVLRTGPASATSDADGKLLVVVSSSVTSADVNSKFRTVNIPVLTWESAVFDDMGMTGAAAGQFGATAGQVQLQMGSTGHRLAAGLTGTVNVFTSADLLTWGVVPTTALKIATQVGDATHAAIFGYETGTVMVGLNAPARRVGFYFGDAGPAKWTAQGSSLFRAAFLWAAGSADPFISSQPANQTRAVGQTATFSVTAAGSGSLSYQWKKDNVNVSGGTGGNTASYTTPALGAGDNGAKFSCAITGANGTTTTIEALLSVAGAPVITTQPSGATVSVGQTASFTVAATGATSYQWRKNGANIGGATSASYTTPATVISDNNAMFSVVVSNSTGSVTSNNALLVVGEAPIITSQPINDTLALGQVATFSVSATGPGSLAYQWRKNDVNIPGATGSTHNTPPTTSADFGSFYSCIVTNMFGSVTSSNAFLVMLKPVVITAHPLNVTVAPGETAIFNVGATGEPPLAYQWRRNGTAIPGATTPKYSFNAVKSDSGAQFTCQVSNPVSSVISNVGHLIVTAGSLPPVITTHPVSVTVTVGQPISLSVTASGSGPLSYVWYQDSVQRGVGQTLVIGSAVPVNAGNWQVSVSNSAGMVWSKIAVVTVLPAGGASTRDWMTITGELFDFSGNPVGPAPGAPASTDMEVRLFSGSTGGTSLYSETFFAADNKSIPVSDGYFALRLGQGTTTSNLASVIAGNASLYAEILVGPAGSQDALSPRTPLTAAPYSISSASAKTGSVNPNSGAVAGALGAYYIETSTGATWLKTNTVWVKVSP